MLKQIFLVTLLILGGVASTQAQTTGVKNQILNRIIQLGGISREEVKERGGADRILNIRSIDLNRDGKPEYLVDCECVPAGTPFVFRKTTKGVKDLYMGEVRSTVTLAKGYTKGWRNLQWEAGNSPGYQEQPLRFDGTRYQK